jgi:hypothetical protein
MVISDSFWCDRCPSRASSRVTLPSGSPLYFCAHHLREHRFAIPPSALIKDESYLLGNRISDGKKETV